MEDKVMGIFDDYKYEAEVKRDGDYRLAIGGVEESVSKSSGNPMLVLTHAVSGLKDKDGKNVKIKDYIVKNDFFNSKLSRIFDSFDIGTDNHEPLEWIGAMGAAKLKTDDNGFLKIARYIPKGNVQDKLPAWDGDAPERQRVTNIDIEAEDDLPFEGGDDLPL